MSQGEARVTTGENLFIFIVGLGPGTDGAVIGSKSNFALETKLFKMQ